MNNRPSLILTFKYISELNKGDVFTLEHNGQYTEYYMFLGVEEGVFYARPINQSNRKEWKTDFRIIEVLEFHGS